MKKKLIAFLTALPLWLTGAVVYAADWPLADMNKTIEQTNFVVDGHCSGTLISLKERLVLTNFHCISERIEVVEEDVAVGGIVRHIKRQRMQNVALTQDAYTGYSKVRTTSYVARIVAEDQKRDLAVVQIQGDVPQTYASPLGDDVQRGERIYTVGNPAMWENSVFEGVVSNVNRTFEFPWTGGEKTPMIQFSGGIVGGNSGGALYNATGQLVGVPSAASRASDVLGLAIPMVTVKKFLADNCLMAADAAKCAADKKKADKKAADDED